MTMKTVAVLFAATVALGSAGTLTAQQGTPAKPAKPAYKRSIPKALAAKARIGEDSARTLALAKVPNGKVQSLELEEEKGKLIYSIDIKVPGKSGIEEVAVDALTGSVGPVEHETPADEAREAKAEARERAPAKKGAPATPKKDTTRKP